MIYFVERCFGALPSLAALKCRLEAGAPDGGAPDGEDEVSIISAPLPIGNVTDMMQVSHNYATDNRYGECLSLLTTNLATHGVLPMSPVTRADVVQQLEHSPTNGDHSHDFSHAYQSIVQLQREDGGASSAKFQHDMTAINQELHRQGLMPNCDIVGVDGQNHVITRDQNSGAISTQDAGHVADSSSSAQMNGREREDQMLAQAFGLSMTKNNDGTYNISDPFDNPDMMAAGILNKVFNGIMGGGGSDNSNSGQGDTDPANLALGMNPLMAQAWAGWGSDPTQPTDDTG